VALRNGVVRAGVLKPRYSRIHTRTEFVAKGRQPMRFVFDWDPRKAASNQAKHGVTFDDAMSVFLDPLHLSRLDQNHGTDEERWVTLGMNRSGKLMIIVHTFAEVGMEGAMIRII
jgi:uncharacterized DUF497 family protein